MYESMISCTSRAGSSEDGTCGTCCACTNKLLGCCVVAAPAPDHPSPDAGDAANGTESKPGFVAAVDCGGPRGLSLALGGRDASDLVGENLAALRASCGTQCAFDVDEAALRVVVRAPDASSRQCAVLAVTPSPSFGR